MVAEVTRTTTLSFAHNAIKLDHNIIIIKYISTALAAAIYNELNGSTICTYKVTYNSSCACYAS